MTKPTLTTTVISDLAWEQLTNMDAPANSPIASTVAGVAPVQSWEETDQVLPNIGQVDNELLAAAGLSNTILISVKTEEVLKTITVSIGANGNWFVGGEDTGVAAKGTDEATIARPTGVYGVASVFHVGNTLTIGAGLMYCVKEGQNFFTMQTTAELNISVDASTTFVTIDRTGTVRTYSSGINLWTIPESQALVALIIDTDGTVSSFAVPTVHNAMLMASAVIPYSQGAIEAASTATLQATIASQFALQANQSAVAAEAAKTITQENAVSTTTNVQLTEQYKTDAQAAATSAHQFADFADADRVATAADRAQVATDKAAVATDRSTVATDKGIVASDKAITLGYKNDAAASKNLAAEYAIKPEDSVITGTVSDYSALHWAQKAQQWAQAVSAALVWKGQWSATMGAAPPTPAIGTGAHFYRISGAGTIAGTEYAIGDYIHWDTVGRTWFKIDGTDAVITVNGKAPTGGNVALNYSDVGAEQAGVAATLIGTHAATANVHAISAINGLQAALDAKYSPSNKPAPTDIGALPLTGGTLTGTLTSASGVKAAISMRDGASVRFFNGSSAGFHQFVDSASELIVGHGVAGESKIQSIDYLGVLKTAGQGRLYGDLSKPAPADIGALAATSYKPRSDSLNLTEKAIALIENKDMNTCIAGDFGLYNKINCSNSPAYVASWYYCETKAIYGAAKVQLAFPYDNQGIPCYRNYSANSQSWSVWRPFNDLGVVFSGQMRGTATGGSYASVYSRNDAPFTSSSTHSGSSFAPALNITYTHNGGWAGTYYVGDLCESGASAGSLSIGHINNGGGENWNILFRGSDGYAYFPNSMSAADYQIRSDRAVKGNFEPITNALEKVAALEVAIYDKYSDTSKTTKIVREYGTIANSMQAIDELLVAENKGLLYNSVSGQLALLTAAIQELKIKTGV